MGHYNDPAHSDLERHRAERQEARPADPRTFPGNCHKCGLPRSDNPHPQAGKPPHYLEVGCPKECIPCLTLSRHQWAQRAMKAESELNDLKEASALTADQRRALEAAIRILGNGDFNSRYAEFLKPLLGSTEPCVNEADPKECYRVRCQLGNKCADDNLSIRVHEKSETGDLLEAKLNHDRQKELEAIDANWRAHNRLANVPHHSDSEMRIIGFVVPVSTKWPMACIQEQLAEIIEGKK